MLEGVHWVYKRPITDLSPCCHALSGCVLTVAPTSCPGIQSLAKDDVTPFVSKVMEVLEFHIPEIEWFVLLKTTESKQKENFGNWFFLITCVWVCGVKCYPRNCCVRTLVLKNVDFLFLACILGYISCDLVDHLIGISVNDSNTCLIDFYLLVPLG